MRTNAFLVVLLVAIAGSAGPARAQEYPWCAHYDMGDEALNCGFVSYAQCMATVSGIGGSCMANNTYRPAAPAARPIRRAHRQAVHAPS